MVSTIDGTWASQNLNWKISPPDRLAIDLSLRLVQQLGPVSFGFPHMKKA